MGVLRRLFGSTGKPDQLASLATSADSRDAFLRALVGQGIVVVASLPDPRGNVSFLDYSDQGKRIFPIFSSQDRAVEFVQALPHEKVTPYQHLIVTAAFLIENDWSSTRLVLNPRSASETEITADDLRTLRQIMRGH